MAHSIMNPWSLHYGHVGVKASFSITGMPWLWWDGCLLLREFECLDTDHAMRLGTTESGYWQPRESQHRLGKSRLSIPA